MNEVFSTSDYLTINFPSPKAQTVQYLPSVWPQLLQGWEGGAAGWGVSGRAGCAGGVGFFQPLHLQFSSAC